jgi:hypothetical protein
LRVSKLPLLTDKISLEIISSTASFSNMWWIISTFMVPVFNIVYAVKFYQVWRWFLNCTNYRTNGFLVMIICERNQRSKFNIYVKTVKAVIFVFKASNCNAQYNVAQDHGRGIAKNLLYLSSSIIWTVYGARDRSVRMFKTWCKRAHTNVYFNIFNCKRLK